MEQSFRLDKKLSRLLNLQMNKFRFAYLLLFAVVAPLHSAYQFDQSKVPLEIDAPNKAMRKVILLAGKPSSKTMAHEYFAGCALLMNWLKEQPGVWPVMAREWPKDEKVLDGAKVIVYFGDGGGKQPFVDPKNWGKLTNLLKEGAGFVLLHQAIDFPKGQDADVIKASLGGVFHSDIGCRGHWDMNLKPTGNHPVLRGVSAFSAPGDGWLYNVHFAPDAVPLLTGTVPDNSRSSADAKKHIGREEVIAWAYQRPNGGRGFAFTGADLHKSWGYESQRRLVINGILWCAKIEIPEGGAKSTFNDADIKLNLDKKTDPASTKKPATIKSTPESK